MNISLCCWLFPLTVPAVLCAPAPWNDAANYSETREEMKRVLNLLQEQNNILDTICDRESANAAATKLIDSFTRYFSAVGRLDSLIESLPPQEQRELEAADRDVFSMQKSTVYEKIQAIQAANCYMSQALQAAFSLFFSQMQ